MPTVDEQRAVARRRTRPLGGYDAGVPGDRVEDLVRWGAEPAPWAARRHGRDRVFRGRLHAGTTVLPQRIAPSSRHGITVGLASRPVVLRSVGVAHPVPANVPWVVLPNAEWRVVTTEPTDLRVVLTHEVRPDLVATTLTPHRPLRLEGRELKIARAAISSATPVWVDARTEPVRDLAAVPRPGWSLVGQGPDQHNAFLLMMTWAFEQRSSPGDQRVAGVADFINARLADPTLSTGSIAADLRVSRRTLQALFESEGGVAAYIRRQRLAAVLRVLGDAGDQLPDLDVVAAATGLGSRRTLERAMRQVYGLTPRQARSQLLAGRLLRERTDDELAG